MPQTLSNAQMEILVRVCSLLSNTKELVDSIERVKIGS
jgi:hypothetical protein